MPDILGSLKQYGSFLGSGLIKETVPVFAGGFINELFHQWHVDLSMVTELVQNDQSLWDRLDDATRGQLSHMAQKLGGMDFITPEFLITSIRRDFSGVASLFLNWPEAMEWLDRQINELKAGVTGESQEKID
jgi:hypothetical protein